MEADTRPHVEPGNAVVVRVAISNQVWAAIAIRSQGSRSADRKTGSDHASEGTAWLSRLEQFPTTTRIGMELPAEAGVPRLVRADDPGSERERDQSEFRRVPGHGQRAGPSRRPAACLPLI